MAKKLDRALAAWREEGLAGRLSAESRSRIGAELRRHRSQRPLAPLFAPLRRLLIAGAVPVLLTGAVLFWGGRPDVEAPLRLEAQKIDGKVVFNIANGGKTHRVTRSTVPGQFEADSAVEVQGRYVETAEGGPGLVFYRID